MPEWLFFLGFSFLLAHELDAVRAHEWRLLPCLKNLSDTQGRDAFIMLHVPVVALLIWLTAYPPDGVRFWAQAAIDIFLIVHVGLHRAFVGHPDYDFHSPLSRGLIWGAGVVGAAHLALLIILPE